MVSHGVAYRNCESLDSRIEAIRARMEAARTSHLDGMPHVHSGDSDRLGAALAQIEELQEEAIGLRTSARSLRHQIDSTIKKITGPGWPDRRAVLQMRYIDGAAWLEVAGMLFGNNPNYDERQDSFLRRVQKLHAAALAAIAEFVPLEDGQENGTEME